MEKHRVLHSGIKKEICDECGKAFALHSYLVRHQMLHQKERDIQMGIVEEQERHLCSECGKVFSKAHYLSRHLERHIRGKCYECRISQISFLMPECKTRCFSMFDFETNPLPQKSQGQGRSPMCLTL
jgi:uncharacterized Zn-finger protein